jgi:extradiol dioxygenase family protein
VKQDLVEWLYGLQSHGIKLGLDGIRALVKLLDHPDRAYPIALVGGTNGKGSVAAMLDAMLGASGLRTGLYTSPHLVRPNERIRIAGEDVTSWELDRVLSVVRSACERGLADGSLAAHPSFFEVMTAAALCSFRDARVDAAVLEVGLGGRLDATNATEPLVSAIVTVGLDHLDMLGTTLEAIAIEKAGIARAGRPLISGVVQSEVVAVIRVRCDALGATFLDARTTQLPSGVRLTLDGGHQRSSARCAADRSRCFSSLRWPTRTSRGFWGPSHPMSRRWSRQSPQCCARQRATTSQPQRALLDFLPAMSRTRCAPSRRPAHSPDREGWCSSRGRSISSAPCSPCSKGRWHLALCRCRRASGQRMPERYIFHLALPVHDLEASKQFYVRALGADVGRENAEWFDVLLWGHQITLHLRPDEVLPKHRQGKRHFGVVLPWSSWQRIADHVRAEGIAFLREPEILMANTPQEHAKFYLEDPSNNVIEIKAYVDPPAALEALVQAVGHREAVHDDLDALCAGGERGDGVVVGRSGVDDERLAGRAGDLDLGQEGALLVRARGAVAVVVEPGLPHRAAQRLGRELGQIPRGRVVEALGRVGVAADRGEHLVEPLGRSQGGAVALLVHPDREDAVHARRARRRHQLVLGRGAVVEMGVRVDHWGLGNKGGSSPIEPPPGPSPKTAAPSSTRSSPSAASSLPVDSGI